MTGQSTSRSTQVSLKLLAIATAALSLGFAYMPNAYAQGVSVNTPTDEVFVPFLRIKNVTLFPSDANAEIRLRAYVNGIEFHYPQQRLAFLREGTLSAARQAVRLPLAETYQVRFEMLLADGVSASSNRMPEYRQVTRTFDAKAQFISRSNPVVAVSQQISNVALEKVPRPGPIRAQYKVYEVVGETRSSIVKAVISYELGIERACGQDPC